MGCGRVTGFWTGGKGAGSIGEDSTGTGAVTTGAGRGAGADACATDSTGRVGGCTFGFGALGFFDDARTGADVGPPSMAETTICGFAAFGASSTLEPPTATRSRFSPSSIDGVLDPPQAASSTAIAAANDAATCRVFMLPSPNARPTVDVARRQRLTIPSAPIRTPSSNERSECRRPLRASKRCP